MKLRLIAAAAIGSFTFSAPAKAVTTFTTNFDSVAVPSGGFIIVQSVEGWTATAGDGIELQNNAAGTPFSPNNLVELDSNNNSEMTRVILPGVYTITFRYSPRPGVDLSSNGIRLIVDSVGAGDLALSGIGLSDTQWGAYFANFTTTTVTNLRFRAIGTSDSLGGYLDNISLTGSAVPEPATWAMMIMGFGLIGGAMRRRQAGGMLATA